MAVTALPTTAASNALEASLATVYTASGKRQVVAYVCNPTTAAIDLNFKIRSASATQGTIQVLPKDFVTLVMVLADTEVLQLGGSTSLVWHGNATEVA